jgi:hypothetical protein
MSRSRHPNKHIELAIQYAESLGWRVELSRGHAWGHLLCPRSTREGCIVSVWSTPKNPENHARHIRRDVDMCPHGPTAQSQQEQENVEENDEHEAQDRM